MPETSLKSELQNLIILCGIQSFVEPEAALMEDEDILSSLAIIQSQRYTAQRSFKIVSLEKQWWEIAIFDSEYDKQLFKTHFRMKRSVFWNLCELLKDQGQFSDYQEPVHLQLAVALYRFGMYGNSAGLVQLAAKFNCGQGSILNFTDRVISSLVKLSSKFISWPNAVERNVIGHEMAVKLLPKCIGFVDGTDVIFSSAPKEHKETYWSRKKHYCMQVQIVCVHNKRIIDLFTGFPGSVHDSKVYNSCPLGVSPSRYFTDGEFIIGDSAYTLTETVVVPFRRTGQGLTSLQKRFNRHISSERVKVEHTIGMLKGRFKSLTDLRVVITAKVGHKRACDWVHACAILHNYLIHEDEWEITTDDNDDSNEEEEVFNAEPNKRGFYKRQALLEIYSSMCT